MFRSDFDIVMRALVDAYENADHWSIRRQLLAIISADFPTSLIQKYFIGLSRWKIESSRIHARNFGKYELKLISLHCHFLSV